MGLLYGRVLSGGNVGMVAGCWVLALWSKKKICRRLYKALAFLRGINVKELVWVGRLVAAMVLVVALVAIALAANPKNIIRKGLMTITWAGVMLRYLQRVNV